MSESNDGAFCPAEILPNLYTVEDIRTTAKRLAAYHGELIAAGFAEVRADEFTAAIAPCHINDLVIGADVEEHGPPIGDDIDLAVKSAARELVDGLERKATTFGRVGRRR